MPDVICISVQGRTRSSLVAGIFERCGAWVGDTRIAYLRGYDTYENHEALSFIQRFTDGRYFCRIGQARRIGPRLNKFMSYVLPKDRPACFKFTYYFHHVFQCAYPWAHFYYCTRSNYNPGRKERYETYLLWLLRKGVPQERIIDTDLLLEHDWSQIRPIVESHGLTWNEEAVSDLMNEPKSKQFTDHKVKVRRR